MAGATWDDEAGCFVGAGETGGERTGKIVTFAKKAEQEEKPGTVRALQCWLQKLEYCNMQQKMALKTQQEELVRQTRALTNMERRQDSQQAQPTDFLRHWDAAKGEEKKLLAAQAVRDHMKAGACCLPSLFLWLWSLKVARRAMAVWAREAEAEQEAGGQPGSQAGTQGPPADGLGDFTVLQWNAWLMDLEDGDSELGTWTKGQWGAWLDEMDALQQRQEARQTPEVAGSAPAPQEGRANRAASSNGR